MIDEPPPNAQYVQICIKGTLETRWGNRFAGMTITHTEHGETLLTGLMIDQAALYGLLRKIRDLGLPLLSVNPVEPDAEEASER